MSDIEICELLQSEDLFGRIGKQDIIEGVDVKFVKSIDEFVKKESSIRWFNAKHNRTQDIFVQLSLKGETYQKMWTDWGDENSDKVKGLLTDRLKSLDEELFFEEDIYTDLYLSFIDLGLANRFKEFYYDEFWDELLLIFRAGHIPCGYNKGTFLAY